jgi:hypothetical protein
VAKIGYQSDRLEEDVILPAFHAEARAAKDIITITAAATPITKTLVHPVRILAPHFMASSIVISVAQA